MPPPTGKVYVLPSDPATSIAVALVAVMVRVDELPGLIEAGLPLIATVVVPEL